MQTYDYLAGLMDRYRADSLVGISPQAFKSRIDEFLAMLDAEMEGFRDPSMQRDLSIKFHWGHNHDFGDFKLEGRMGDRHVALLATFIDQFSALPRDLTGKRVLDIGCWTGGSTLLLAAMGAEVVAIEEVRKYVDAANFLKDSFNIEKITFLHSSLYDFTDDSYFGYFDYVIFAGVIYHLTDPILGARIAYNATRDGGYCLVESEAIPNNGNSLQYHGSDIIWGGSQEQLNRGGWNWFVPSPAIMAKWMREAGFVDVRENEVHPPRGRAFAVGLRDRHRDLNRAGLSVPHIR